MYFRIKNGSFELIKGSPVQVAFEICFFAREDEVRRYAALPRDERRKDDLRRIEMQFGSDDIQYSDSEIENHRRLAKELGLAESTNWWNVLLANMDYLAKLLEIPLCQDVQQLNRAAIRICAVELGLSRDAEWLSVIEVYRERRDEILARFNYEFSG